MKARDLTLKLLQKSAKREERTLLAELHWDTWAGTGEDGAVVQIVRKHRHIITYSSIGVT